MVDIAGVRMTPQTGAVLKALLDGPNEGLYGLQLTRTTHLPTGSIYPILTRLEQAGWIVGAWEDADQAAVAGRRRRRRFYALNAQGRYHARQAVEQLQLRWGALLSPQVGAT